MTKKRTALAMAIAVCAAGALAAREAVEQDEAGFSVVSSMDGGTSIRQMQIVESKEQLVHAKGDRVQRAG
ncbi:MAG TPA: hypothetical protein V6D17_14400 [Candidatus Obscuribacterales bacterium]